MHALKWKFNRHGRACNSMQCDHWYWKHTVAATSTPLFSPRTLNGTTCILYKDFVDVASGLINGAKQQVS